MVNEGGGCASALFKKQCGNYRSIFSGENINPGIPIPLMVLRKNEPFIRVGRNLVFQIV